MTLFVNHTRRSANAVLADLAACRQFRHVTEEQRQAILDDTIKYIRDAKAPWVLKHPDPDNPCLSCGGPRSVYSWSRMGLCWRCYVTNLVDFWCEDVFIVAIREHHLSCDACDEVFLVPEAERRQAAIRCLDNIDGMVKPILCVACARDFKAFCSRHFGHHWRSLPKKDI